MSDKLKKIFESDEHGLLNLTQRAKAQSSSDRLESSFLQINDFYTEHGKEPDAKTTNVSERKLGVRLRGFRADDDKINLLKHLDVHNLLAPEDPPESLSEVFSDDELGLFDDPTGILTITNVPRTIQSADYKASQKKSDDFDIFEPKFIKIHQLLASSDAELIEFVGEQSIVTNEFFILKGLVVYVAGKSDLFVNKNKKTDARLRLIYENGTESDVLMRTLARELYRNGKRIVLEKPSVIADDDVASGYIYILSSLSDDPKVANVADLYKIGFSTNTVEQRIKHARDDPTYLMAPVKVVSTYKAFNMNTQKFEALLHRVFAQVRLNVEMINVQGEKYTPTEWFVAPLNVIDSAVRMIISGDIVNYKYDLDSKSLVWL